MYETRMCVFLLFRRMNVMELITLVFVQPVLISLAVNSNKMVLLHKKKP